MRHSAPVSYAEHARFRWFDARVRGSINIGKHMPHPIVRFAPSPTGRLHIGNARTALLNFLYAKKRHGEFILRFDDTDVERSKEEFAQAIEVDLAWLGIVPAAVLRQSGRFALYQAPASARPASRLR